MFETVVIATDGSESAERAVETALDFTERFEADLHALAVIDEDATDRAEVRAVVENLASRAERGGTAVIRAGDPASGICSYAREIDADVVIMGTRGRGGPYRFHLGSVASAVVNGCSAPVLTIRGAGSNHEVH